MKKNILRKDFIMEIRRTRGRFISIFFIVALGVAFYSGIRASEPSMRISGDAYFDSENLMDIKVMGTLGLTKDDVKAIEKTKGIEFAEGGYSKDVLCTVGESEVVVHMLSMQRNFNTVQLAEGRLPKEEGECLLDEDFAASTGFRVGDTLKFRSGDEESLEDTLVTDTYTIVGIGNSPLYISFGRGNSIIGTGEVRGFVAVDDASFKMDVYTEVYARVTGSAETTAFTQEYYGLTDAARDALKGIERERCKARREEILGEAAEELEDAEKEIEDESGKLEDAKKSLEEAKSLAARKLAEARRKLEQGEAELADSKKKIAEGEQQIAEGKKQLTQKQQELDEGQKQYEEGAAELSEKEKELAAGEAEYQALCNLYMPIITAGKEQIASGRSQLAGQMNPVREELDHLTGIQAELQRIDSDMYSAVTARDMLIKQRGDGQKLYEEYEAVPQEERTEQQIAYLENWQEEDAALAIQIEDLKQQIAEYDALRKEQIEQMKQAGVLSEDLLNIKIEELKRRMSGFALLEAALDKVEELVKKQEQELVDAGQQIADGKAQIADAKKVLEASKSQLDAGQRQINDAWGTLREKEQTLNAGKAQLGSGQKELQQGRSEYQKAEADARGEIADGEKKLSDGEKELIKARQEIADAKAEIEKVEHPKWYIWDRGEALVDYEGYGENADRMRSLGKVFPVLFFLVAALISLTTMTRMVEEQRTQIGTLKALGYDKFSIAKKYIYYALTATLGGSVVGVLFGEKILPFIIIYAYKIMYQHIPDILVPYHMSYAVQATLIAVACTLFATIFSCYKELLAEPAKLMRPAAPKQGKRIWLEKIPLIWKRLNFTWKSSIRNLIRYKKRFFMTIFGIGGCMALMVVGFGLKDCIYEIAELQYDQIQFYDATAFMTDEIPDEEREQILEYLGQDADVERYIQTRMQKVKVRSDSEEESLYLMVPEDAEQIEEFVSFHSRTKKGESYTLSKEQVILTEKMADMLGVEVGDTVIIEDEDRGDKEVTIDAVCENYMGHYLYLSPEKYEELHDAPPRYNSELYAVKEGKEDQIERIGSALLKYENVLNVSYTSSIEGRLDDMLKSLNLVIVVLIISAGMLAFVVLYNLNNINITERQRELATLKVLGFYDMEVASYVYRENILLTLLGSVVGMGLGNMLLQFIIVTVEVEEAMFGRQIQWESYLMSFLLTLVFSLFVNWVMFYKLRKINMVESLKSVE